MQIHRLFEIVYILLQQKIVTAKDLSKRFEVSRRTIYRDIDVLGMAGIPVYTEKGKGGGISILPDFVLNKSILSEQEQTEILSALHGLSTVKTAETGRVLQRLSAVFNKTAANWLEVDFSSWAPDNSGFFRDLKTAILERRVTEFDYYSIYGKTTRKKTRRRIEPVQLWFKSTAWYIKGFCLSRQEMRTFKLNRIRNLKVTDEFFQERKVSEFHEEHEEQEMQDLILKFRVDPEMHYRVYDEFDDSMVKKQQDGSFLVTTKWPEDEWVYGRILSWGEHLEVLEPEHIRRIISEKAEKTRKKYL